MGVVDEPVEDGIGPGEHEVFEQSRRAGLVDGENAAACGVAEGATGRAGGMERAHP